MVTIPQRLQDDKIRLIKLAYQAKNPIEPKWQDHNNYTYYDKSFQDHIKNGGNYGVLTGEDNLIVLDFDSQKLQDEIVPKLPKTFTVKTGSGLLHKYFKTDNPESFKLLDAEKNTLADIQGKGKQVVGPGSIHPNGNKYELIDNSEIAFLSMAENKALLADYLPKEQEVKQTTGNNKQADDDKAAIRAKINVPDLLRHYGIDTGRNPTCCPMHNSKGGKCLSFKNDLWHCFHCEEGGDIFSLMMAKEGISFAEAIQKLAKMAQIELKQTKQEATKQDFKIYSLQEIFDKGIKEPSWRVENIVTNRGITIIGGASCSYKSWIAMHLALSCATGRNFLDRFETEQCNVLYVDEENGDVTLPKRFQMLCKAYNYNMAYTNIFLSIFNNVKLDTSIGREQLKLLIDTVKPKVVIVDSMVRCLEGDENEASDVRKIFENLKLIFENHDDISFVILHHTTKAAANGSFNGLRGSGDFAAFADVVLMFSSNYKGFVNVNVAKNRHVDMTNFNEFSIKINGTEDLISFEYVEKNQGSTDAVNIAYKDYLDWIENENIKVWESGNMLKKLANYGNSKDAIYKLRKRLLDDKEIRKLSHGKYEVLSNDYIVGAMQVK